MSELRFLLMDQELTEPQGFVLIEEKPRIHYDREESQYLGFDTSGEPLFSRKGMRSADTASKGRGLRMVTVGYFGIPTRDGMTAVETMRAREAERRERVPS
jgi:hypothetical protein